MGGVVDLLYGVRHCFERAQPPQVVPNVRDGLWWRSDFLTAASGIAGEEGLTYVTAGTGANSANAVAGHPGIYQGQVTALNDLAMAIAMASSTSNVLSAGAGGLFFEALVRIPTLSDGVNNLLYRVGFGDVQTVADETDAIAFECDRTVNGSNNWFLLTASNGVRTRTNLNVAPVANAWTRLRMQLDGAATQANAIIDGVPVGNAGGNIPSGAARLFSFQAKIAKTLGAGILTAEIDYAEFGQSFGSRR